MNRRRGAMSDVDAPQADAVLAEEGEGDTPGWVALRLGDAELGVAIERVREVLHPPEISRVPLAPPSVLGVVSVRREVVPVVDLGERVLGRAAQRGRLVVVSHGAAQEPVGLLVDAVSGLIPRGASTLDSPPDAIAASVEAGMIANVVEFGDRTIAILELDRVLDIPLVDKAEEAP